MNRRQSTSSPLRSFVWGCLFLVSLCAAQTKSNQTIQGHILLDSQWNPVVYLSEIPTFKDMYTMSTEMIIAQASVDRDGSFSFPSNYLPAEDRLFRLHISKKDAPSASLIIGGIEENHYFLIANNKDFVTFTDKDTIPLFGKMEFGGYRPNRDLQEINELVSYMDSTQFEGSTVKGEFVQKAIQEKLRLVADTSSHPLVSLYAMYQSKFESNYPLNPSYYESYLEKWDGESSTYFNTFRSNFPDQDSNNYYYIIIGLVFFALGFAIHKWLAGRRNKNGNQLKSLSIQERKIFDLIRSGKSNKDISEECNIGVSTVKSHVSNIYSKLNIKSRKEAMDY